MRNKSYYTKFASGNKQLTYAKDRLHTFNFSRFMPPELMGYKGRALVIDPDVFSFVDVRELFDLDLKGKAIAAISRTPGYYKSSVMVLDCAKLKHWKIENILKNLMEGTTDWSTLVSLKNESVLILPQQWNEFDKIYEDTKMLHTTREVTQPWRTGLPVTFMTSEEKPMPKIFGIIPREWIHALLGRKREIPTHIKPHPEPAVEKFFFDLANEALEAGAINRELIQKNIEKGHIRVDFFEVLKKFPKKERSTKR